MTGTDPEPPLASRRDSPRTDAEPLAFTRAEFLKGTARAWGATTLLLIVSWAVLTGGFSLVVGTVMIVIALLPLPGFLISLFLPDQNASRSVREEPVRT